LWPFSTLGWPENTVDLQKFYPTTALVTAYDIIFFWVSRMIMAGLEFTGKAPFHDIYIHGLVRDKQGRKMSKSLGNGIDPLEIIEQYGSDALKFTLSFLAAQGQDVKIDNKTFEMGSKFCNKVWNASRYILGNLEGRNLIAVKDSDLTELDKWIYLELNNAAKSAREALESYRYNDATSSVYEFFWYKFCDWYVEATKLSFWHGDEHEKDRQISVLLNILEESLRLLHPFIPFVTEEIYSKLPRKEIIENRKSAGTQKVLPNETYEDLLTTAPYPEFIEARNDSKVAARFNVLQDLIKNVRGLRNECGINPADKINIALHITSGSDAEVCKEKIDTIKLLAGLANIEFVESKPTSSIGTVGSGYEAFILLDENIDKESLKKHFDKDLEKSTSDAQKIEFKLNGKFAEHAPAEVVQAERDTLAEIKRRIEKLTSYINEL